MHTMARPACFLAGPGYRYFRHGCPLSALLFSFALKSLMVLVRTTFRNRVGPSHCCLSNVTYADDFDAILRDDAEFPALKRRLDLYCSASVARVNIAKSFVLWSCSWTGHHDDSLGIKSRWDGGKFLGVFLGNTAAYTRQNWEFLFPRFRRVLGRWFRYRHLCSVTDRVLVVNQLAGSVLWHCLKVLQPPDDFLHQAQKIILDFIWDGIHWINGPTLYQERRFGGVGLVDFSTKVRAFRIAAAYKLLARPDASDPPVVVAHATLCAVPNPVFHFREFFLRRPAIRFRYSFYQSLFDSWFALPFRLLLNFTARDVFLSRLTSLVLRDSLCEPSIMGFYACGSSSSY